MQGIINDNKNKQELISKGKKLCERCEGTGNELYSMYKKCIACNGSGIMLKAYIVGDDDSTLCVCRCENSSKARYEAFKLYGSQFGVNFVEFQVYVKRFKQLDNINFDVIDAVDIGSGTDLENKETWTYEEITNAVKKDFAVIQ